MDLIGPFKKTTKDLQYVLTVTDYFSKYVEAVPLEDKSAISVAKGIFKVYCRQGAPVHCICDQGIITMLFTLGFTGQSKT